MVERDVPLQWLMEPLDGPNAYIDVPYILHEEEEEVDYQHHLRHIHQRQAHSITTGEGEDGGGGDDGSHSDQDIDGGNVSVDTVGSSQEVLVVKNGISSSSRDIYQCLLCETGRMNSAKSCQNHVKGKKHTKNYQRLQRQQIAYSLDQQASKYITNLKEVILVKSNSVNTSPTNGGRNGSGHSTKKSRKTSSLSSYANYWSICCDDSQEVEFLSFNLSEEEIEQEDVPHYILPYRRWHYDGYWITGWTCELCGTREMTTRSAALQHCLTSKRHTVHRNSTLRASYDHGGCVMYGEYHPECQRLLRHIECKDDDSGDTEINDKEVSLSNLSSSSSSAPNQSLLLPKVDIWRIERMMLHYLAYKESSMLLGIDSRQNSWHNVLRKYQYYHRRYILSLLELTIWKHHMISSLLPLPYSSTYHDGDDDNGSDENDGTNSVVYDDDDDDDGGDDDGFNENNINTNAIRIKEGNEGSVGEEDHQECRTSSRKFQTFPELRQCYEHHYYLKDKDIPCWESFKEECRVTSGFTVIIAGVVPFLSWTM